jgi:hypothetical protein
MLHRHQDVEIGVGLVQVVREGIVDGDIGSSRECDLRILGAFREWVT